MCDQYQYIDIIANDCNAILGKYALHETLLNCALTLKRRRIKTIAITNHQENTLSKRCDYVIPIPFYTNKDRFDELQFHMTTKYIFDCLFSVLYSYDIEKAKQMTKIHTDIFFDKM